MPIDKKKYDVVSSKRMDRNLYIVLKDKRCLYLPTWVKNQTCLYVVGIFEGKILEYARLLYKLCQKSL